MAHGSGYAIVWKHMTQADLLEASRRSFSGDLAPLTTLIQRNLHRDVPLHAHTSARASRSMQDAPPLAPPSDAILRALAEQEQKRVQVLRTPAVRRFEARDEGMVQFGGVETIEGRHVALVHRQDELLVLSMDDTSYKKLTSVKQGQSVQVSSTGSIRLGRGRKR